MNRSNSQDNNFLVQLNSDEIQLILGQISVLQYQSKYAQEAMLENPIKDNDGNEDIAIKFKEIENICDNLIRKLEKSLQFYG